MVLIAVLLLVWPVTTIIGLAFNSLTWLAGYLVPMLGCCDAAA